MLPFTRKIKRLHRTLFAAGRHLTAACCLCLLASCAHIDLYEKVVSIPGYKWESSFQPVFTFEVKDTTVPYQLFLILRHNDKYNYNNIWLNIHTKVPGGKTASKARYEIPLATTERGWLASGLDDLYEHRIALTPAREGYFKKPGLYTFTIEHIMRDEPLEHVMNVGLRLEKNQP